MKVIPEADLRALSREFGRLLPKTNSIGEQDLKTLEDLLQDLFASTEAAQLSLSHRAAACNALCGFVDTTSTSSILQVKLVSLNTSVCNRILSFYLDRFQDASFRSMKQILTTLSKLMVLYKNGTVGKGFDDWTEDASALSIRYISSSADFSCVKPSILLLEIILSKGLQQRERFFEILFLVQQDLLSRSKAVPVALDSDSNPDQGLQLFVIDILRWSRNSDLCLAGGRLLRILFSEHNHDTYQYNYSDDLFLKVKEPMWLQPVLDLVKDKSVDLEKIEKYILLELLAANKVNILYLARKLPIYRLLHGSSGGIQDSDIRLALLLVKVMEAAELSNSLSEY